MNKQHKFHAPIVGGSSLIVIFAVLCLTVFALLGLSTVRASQKLSDISAKSVSDYYSADSTAEAILAELRAGNIPDGVIADDEIYRYVCPVSDTQALAVEVQVTDKDHWEIISWNTFSTVSWDGNDTLTVRTGE